MDTMKRCNARLTLPCTSALILWVATAWLVASPAHAQISDVQPNVRAFPKTAERGQMVVQAHPAIILNGKAERLSPGARIFDKNNYLVLSGRLVDQDLLVNYLRDGGGQIHQVWILNSEEAKEKRASSTATTFDFNTGNTPAPAAR